MLRLGRRIGVGTDADVFQVRHGTTELAVKAVRAGHRRCAEAREQLISEVGILQRIDHPNLVRIVGVGVLGDSSPAYVMLRGTKTLADVLLRTPRPPRDWAEKVIEQISSGLGALHRIGCVHGDLHGANVLLVDQLTRAVLIDPKPWRPFVNKQTDLVALGRLAAELYNATN